MTRRSQLLAAATRAAKAVGSVALLVVAAIAIVFLLASRGGPGAGATAGGDVVAEASVRPSDPDDSGAAPTPRPAPSAPTPSRAPSGGTDPTAAATLHTTPDPTAAATPVPTKRPPTTTPAPTHDPAPEPTPYIGTASGSFGQTLTVSGIKAFLAPRSPSNDPLIRCGTSDDPEKQGYTEIVSYDLRVTWPNSSDATEPSLAVGSTPYNVLWFDPQGTFKSGVDYVFSTCRRPADSTKVRIEVAPDGDPPRLYRWSFH